MIYSERSAGTRGMYWPGILHCLTPHSLLQVYDAPPLVRHCLANMCNLPNVYIVNHDDTDQVRRLMDDHRIRQVYTPQRSLSFIPSAYGGREDSALSTALLNSAAGRILGSGGAADVEEVRWLFFICRVSVIGWLRS